MTVETQHPSSHNGRATRNGGRAKVTHPTRAAGRRVATVLARQAESDRYGDGRTLNVAYFATQGDGSGDEARITALLAPLCARRLEFDRTQKARSGVTLLKQLLRERPDVVVMEGTGITEERPCLERESSPGSHTSCRAVTRWGPIWG